MTRKALVANLATALLLGLMSACSAEEDNAARAVVHTASDGAEYNDADVEFLDTMIQHHAQAMLLVAMTNTHPLPGDAQILADNVRATNGPQVEQMVAWLQNWGEPVPETSMDHSHGDAVDDSDSSLPGMATGAELRSLEQLRTNAYRVKWLALMTEHHQGAITLTQQELDNGLYGPALELAKAIQQTQRKQMEKMETMSPSA